MILPAAFEFYAPSIASLSFGVAFAGRMFTSAVNVRGFFHRLTLGAAVFSRSYDTGTDRVCAFLAFVRHLDLLPFRFRLMIRAQR